MASKPALSWFFGFWISRLFIQETEGRRFSPHKDQVNNKTHC